jgi:predicted ATPase
MDLVNQVKGPPLATGHSGHAGHFGHCPWMSATLYWVSLPYVYCGKYTAAKPLFGELVALAESKSAEHWKPLGMLQRGCELALSGNPADAVHAFKDGISAYQAIGATLILVQEWPRLARAYADLGRFDEAWRSIREGTSLIETTGETWCEAEVYRVAGEIALKSPEHDVAKATAYFERALTVARRQQAKSWELRTAMSMARLWRDQGKRDEARDLLAPVYGWFTEGFDTLDLKEAKKLLDELVWPLSGDRD